MPSINAIWPTLYLIWRWLNQALYRGLHRSADRFPIFAAQAFQPFGLDQLFQDDSAPRRIGRVRQDFRAKFRQEGGPLAESLVKLGRKLVANGLGKQGGTPTGADSDKEIAMAQGGRHQKIAGDWIICGIDPEVAAASVRNHLSVNRRGGGGENQAGSFQVLGPVWFISPFQARLHVGRRAFQANEADSAATIEDRSRLAPADRAAAHNEAKAALEVKDDGIHFLGVLECGKGLPLWYFLFSPRRN
jgi:hypothetical protein